MRTALAALLMGAAFTLVEDASAVVKQGYEKPMLMAEMEKTGATGKFQMADDFELTLTRYSGSEEPTGLILTYTMENKRDGENGIFLRIVHTAYDACGSAQYVAVRWQEPNAEEDEFEATPLKRLRVVLIDHTDRFCRDYQEHLWQATVEEGHGFCGTLDSRLAIVGDPQAVFSFETIN